MTRDEYRALRKRFKLHMINHFLGEVPIGASVNFFIFRVLLRWRFIFFMQQVVAGTGYVLAYHRSMEWNKQQILNWQKEQACKTSPQ